MGEEQRTNDRDVGEPDGDTLREMYRRVMLIRLCGEKIEGAIKGGRILAPFYPVRGHEVISAATAVNLRDDDYMVTIYRGLHDHLAKGAPLKALWAEYAGREAGSCKGKGGPMHITHPASGVVVTTGIVGSGIPIANGLAWASQLRKDGRVTVSSFGDGASNIGAFHEALNMASLWKLPVVFLCQNNGYAEHTRFETCTAVEHVADRAAAYSMEGVTVDGGDPVAMWRAARAAIDKARSGGGPTLLEAVTVRVDGHSMGDACEYIPEAERADIAARDPVPKFRAWMIAQGHADAAGLDAVEAGLAAEIDDAMRHALDAPYPPADELRRDVLDREVAI